MYELFITNKNYSSWSLRPWVLMRELGIPFTERLQQLAVGSSWALFRTFSPSGRMPCLRDGATVVWDSLAITEYLADRHAAVWPRDAAARAWARSAAAEMHSGFAALRDLCSMSCGLRVRLADVPQVVASDIARIDELWAGGLESFGGPFLTGRAFTAADAFYAPVAFRWQTYGFTFGATSTHYARRLLALPAMQAWYADALAEPWREPAHEAEARRAGAWLEDQRARSA
ncbi:MAG TPA: glutathione S-transferase [Steroidobacteraceae bacterium]|nr:glutathione S-transferase [Steroidobacteraceae bacterium]